MVPRIAHRVWASLNGYYWIPCLLCGKFVGGHEHSFERSGVLMISETHGKGTCSDCKELAETINKKQFGRKWRE